METLQLQQAKQQFSSVAEKAAGGHPQMVTKHGKPFVVIVAVDQWEKARRSQKQGLLGLLRNCPMDLTELDFERSAAPSREIDT